MSLSRLRAIPIFLQRMPPGIAAAARFCLSFDALIISKFLLPEDDLRPLNEARPFESFSGKFRKVEILPQSSESQVHAEDAIIQGLRKSRIHMPSRVAAERTDRECSELRYGTSE
jgi:hypothetical protein